MSAIYRLASRNLLTQIIHSNRPQFVPLARHVTLKVQKYEPPPKLNHDEFNEKLARPMSPHLTILHFGLTANLSISHRITGAMLAGYTVLLGAGALVLPHPVSHYIDVFQEMHPSSATLFTIKFLLAFPFSYHFYNGIRHLSWDMGKNLKIKEVYSTGYIMLGATVITSLALSLL